MIKNICIIIGHTLESGMSNSRERYNKVLNILLATITFRNFFFILQIHKKNFHTNKKWNDDLKSLGNKTEKEFSLSNEDKSDCQNNPLREVFIGFV